MHMLWILNLRNSVFIKKNYNLNSAVHDTPSVISVHHSQGPLEGSAKKKRALSHLTIVSKSINKFGRSKSCSLRENSITHRQTDEMTLQTIFRIYSFINLGIKVGKRLTTRTEKLGWLVGWFCCFTSQVNSYGHCGTVSSPNHTFSWAGLNKRLTSNLCTYFRL